MQEVTDLAGLLVCPETKERLRPCSLAEAESSVGSSLVPLREAVESSKSPPFGATGTVLLREDLRRAYPVVDGVPILLAPEALGASEERRSFDLRDPRYAEAYEEMAFYNEVASREAEDITTSEAYDLVAPVAGALSEARRSFPYPKEVWIDAVYDCAAQWDAYSHIAPITGRRVLQLGGKGIHAVKFLLGGAAEAWVITPMLGEARCAMALARAVGVEGRLRCVVAIAEELPLAGDSFDAIYSGGSFHHTVTGSAATESERVLKRGGRFAATDPWRAPLYAIGTKVLGKREPSVYCRPLTQERVEPVRRAFGEASIVQHGALTRYPLLALQKFGVSSSLSTAWRLNKLDDAACSLVPGLRGMGSSVVCLGTKDDPEIKRSYPSVHVQQSPAAPEEAIRTVIQRFPFEGYMNPASGGYLNVAQTVRRHLPPGSSILDFGCGPCDKTAVLQLMGYECSGYDDLQDEWHREGDGREKILAFARECGVDFREPVGGELPFEKHSFDMVMMHDVLEHLHGSPRHILGHLMEFLKPEGLLFVTVPSAVNIRKRIDVLFGKTNMPRFEEYYWTDTPWRGHVREYVKDDLEKLAGYLDLEKLELRSCDHMLEKIPPAARPAYLRVTNLFPGWKDSWMLVAGKKPGWSATELDQEELAGTLAPSAPDGD